MIAKKILVPTDFSPCSSEAIDVAAALAQYFGGEVLIAFVEELVTPADGVGYLYRVPEPNTAEVLQKLKQIVPGGAVRHSHHVLQGEIVDTILNFADAQGVDLVVMGTHGRRGITAVLMGSVAESIVRRAKCPVLTVKASS